MSGSETVRLLSALEISSRAPSFLSSFFRSPEENYFNSEYVEIDIVRDDETIAVPVPNLAADPRVIEASKYVNKRMEPTTIRECGVISAFDMLKRQPGQTSFADPAFLASAGQQAIRLLNILSKRVRRTVELMCAQVLSTGTIALPSYDATPAFSVNFSPKSAHFAAVSVTWAQDGSTGDPLADIDARAALIRANGKRRVTDLVFGASAMQRFLANAKVQKALEKTSLNLGALAPKERDDDTVHFGRIAIGGYTYDLWQYDGVYVHPQTGALTRYLDNEKVLFISKKARLDLCFGGIPRFPVQPAPFLNGRLADPSRGIDLHLVSWLNPQGTILHMESECRPLAIPTEIDSFGCLDVTA